MCAAFLGFVVGRVARSRSSASASRSAVLIDATIVRALLVPALMAVFGRWNWWRRDRRDCPEVRDSPKR